MIEETNQIPKVIHYFWFGKNDKPEIFYKCLESWKKQCPDYEIKEWTEENFDININKYVSEAYEKGKYAFVSDYARFYILNKYGGIYLDIDVEILKNIDDLLSENVFMGFEDRGLVNPGLIMGAKKEEKVIRDILKIYDEFKHFPENVQTVCEIVTDYLVRNKELMTQTDKIQRLEGVTVYPFEYFCACDLITKKMSITENTYTVHHYNASWLPAKEKAKNMVRKIVYTIIGKKNYNKLKHILKRK